MSQPTTTEAKAVFAQYRAALDDFCAQCRATPDQWHSLAKACSALRLLLLPHAAAGDRDCQYSLGTMGLLGLCCESKAEWETGLERALEDATHWWVLAAKQGHSWAVDNLVSSGRGPEADRVRVVFAEVKRDRVGVIDDSGGNHICGPEFMEEVTRRLYGVVRPSDK